MILFAYKALSSKKLQGQVALRFKPTGEYMFKVFSFLQRAWAVLFVLICGSVAAFGQMGVGDGAGNGPVAGQAKEIAAILASPAVQAQFNSWDSMAIKSIEYVPVYGNTGPRHYKIVPFGFKGDSSGDTLIGCTINIESTYHQDGSTAPGGGVSGSFEVKVLGKTCP